jgi:hypothetical protein
MRIASLGLACLLVILGCSSSTTGIHAPKDAGSDASASGGQTGHDAVDGFGGMAGNVGTGGPGGGPTTGATGGAGGYALDLGSDRWMPDAGRGGADGTAPRDAAADVASDAAPDYPADLVAISEVAVASDSRQAIDLPIGIECLLLEQYGCPAGQGCYISNVNGLGAHCWAVGSGRDGETCSSGFSVCAPGYACQSAACHRLCDTRGGVCPTGQTCKALSGLFAAAITEPNVGICTEQ